MPEMPLATRETVLISSCTVLSSNGIVVLVRQQYLLIPVEERKVSFYFLSLVSQNFFCALFSS